MKQKVELLLAFGLFCSSFCCPAQAPSFRWAQLLSGIGSSYLTHLAVDGDGNRYAAGTFTGTISTGSRSLTSTGTEPDGFVAKTLPDGQSLWVRQVTVGTGYTLSDVAVDAHGGLLLTGSFGGRIAFDAVVLNSRGFADGFLVRYDPSGNVAWARQFGGNGYDSGEALLLTEGGLSVQVAGFVGMGPGLSDFFDPWPSVAIFGGGLGGGPTILLNTAINAGFLAKFDLAGALVRAQQVPGLQSTLHAFAKGPNARAVVGQQNHRSLMIPFDEAKGLLAPAPFTPIQGDADAQHALQSYEQSTTMAVGIFDYAGNVNLGSTTLKSASSSWWLFGQTALFGRSLINGEITFAADLDGASRVESDRNGNFYLHPKYSGGSSELSQLDPVTGHKRWSLPTRGASVTAVVPLPDGSLLVGGDGVGTLGLGSFTFNTMGNSVVYIARVSAAPTVDWVRNAGGATAHASAESVAVDPAGNRYVTGWYRGDANFAGHPQKSVQSSTDGFLAKYDKAGTLQWVRSFGGKDFDVGRSVAVDRSGNCYVAGEFNGTATFTTTNVVSKGNEDLFLAKYSSGGTLQWVRPMGGAGEEFMGDLVVDAGANCYLTGAFAQTAEFRSDVTLTSRGSWDVFLAKYSSAGTLQWVQQAGGTADDRGYGVTADATGNLFVTGFYTTYATFGTFDVTGYGGHDIFLAKYDPTGKALWVSKAGGTGIDNAYSVALDGNGYSFVTGIIRGTAQFGGFTVPSLGSYDIFAAKFSPSGQCLWAKSFGSTTADDQAEEIVVDRSGYCYVTGEFRGTAAFGPYTLTSNGGSDAVLFKLESNTGDVLWAKQAGGSRDDLGFSVAIEGDQNWTWAGLCYGTVPFDGQNTVAAADDFFLASSVATFNNRGLFIDSREAPLGSTLDLPIYLEAQGDENAVSFTLEFDPRVLTNVTVLNGKEGEKPKFSQFLVNPSTRADGLLRVVAATGPGTTVPAGTHTFCRLRGTLLPETTASSTAVSFSDELVLREIDNDKGEPLSADFHAGTVTIIRGYEGDIMPQPGGDNQVDLSDWVKAASFAAQLAIPAPGDEGVRADCYPYLVNDVFIGGDGAFTLGDWIQIGRLAVHLDPLRPQGGPDPGGAALAGLSRRPLALAGRASGATESRSLRARPLTLAPGEIGELVIELQASGHENAAAFTLTLDPGLLELQEVALGLDTLDGTLLVNSNRLGSGQLGVMLGLPAGARFAVGVRDLIHVRLKATSVPGAWTNTVEFVDLPVKRQVVDADALELSATYIPGQITILEAAPNPPRFTSIRRVGTSLEFETGGFSTPSVVLEQSDNLLDWAVAPSETGPQGTLVVPMSSGATARFYRLVGR